MEIAREDAKALLAEVEEAQARTRRLVARDGGPLFIVWGLVWIAGYTVTQVMDSVGPRWWPALAAQVSLGGQATTRVADIITGAAWVILLAAGTILSLHYGRRPEAVSTRPNARIGIFLWLLFVYAGLWVGLLMPFVEIHGHDESARFMRHFWAIVATVPMFAYVVMGLWLNHIMVWMGLAVTALTIVGLVFVSSWFWLWMAIFGGGTLTVTGILMRRNWA